MTSQAGPDALRILVVDDNPAIHEDFRKILIPPVEADPALAVLEAELLGEAPESTARPPAPTFVIDSAYQGEEAVALVCDAARRGDHYAMAFVDVRMPPGIDGIQTIQRLWEMDPHIQTVVCTAYSDHSWTSMVQVLGRGDRFLVLKKPFDAIEVIQLADALTTKWLLQRELARRFDGLESEVARRTEALANANRELAAEVAARRQAEENLRLLATHDSLTELPNRLMLHDRLDGALARRRRRASPLGVLLLDLDGFKAVNDTLGHAAGDEVLRQMAKRLQSAIRDCDTVARMGGDEFVILIEDLNAPDDAALVAERVVDACTAPVVVEGRPVQIAASVGIALCPNDGTEAESLLKCADLAMYEAKKSGGSGYSFFNEDLLELSVQRLSLRAELENALDEGQLELWYQPLVDVEHARLRGMEALLRWRHPRDGMILPMTFIPEAERSGAIVPIGRWVLDQALQQLARWHRAGASDLTMAVNVSARQLQQPDLVEMVAKALERSGVAPQHLELEITESAAFADEGLAKSVLARIADLGVGILIDDFGAGHSSLNRLKSLPVDGLKIDRFFIKNIVDDPRDAAMVMAIVTMAHALGIDVVAEGVETADQLERLRSLRWVGEAQPVCDRAQGYFLGRPAPPEAFEGLLAGPPSEIRQVAS